MNITYRALTERQLKQTRLLRTWSFFAFMGLGVILVAAVQVYGMPYGMGPSGWPWAPADWYGVGLTGEFAAMLVAGAVLVFALKMLRIHIMVRRQSNFVPHVAIALTAAMLAIVLAAVLLI